VVRQVKCRQSGKRFACKSIKKVKTVSSSFPNCHIAFPWISFADTVLKPILLEVKTSWRGGGGGRWNS